MISAKEKFLKLGSFLANNYFRAKIIFNDKKSADLPNHRSVIYLANHSGMNFPWDDITLFIKMNEYYGESLQLKPVSVPALFQSRLLQPFGVSQFWRLFSSEATGRNLDHLAKSGQNILLNPEGLDGISKGFDKKYQLQRYSSSFVRIGLKYDRPIVPIYIVNGEYLNPFAYSLPWLNRLAQKIGIPYLPVGVLTPLYLLFPFVMYISLPARLRYVVGSAIDLKDFTTKPEDNMSAKDFRDVAEKVRAHMQLELDREVEIHGKVKFGFGELFSVAKKLGRKSLLLIPLAWPFVFHKIDGEREKGLSAASLFACLSLNLPLMGWPLFMSYLVFNSLSKEVTGRHVSLVRPLDSKKVA